MNSDGLRNRYGRREIGGDLLSGTNAQNEIFVRTYLEFPFVTKENQNFCLSFL
jgi:hypothetical protein